MTDLTKLNKEIIKKEIERIDKLILELEERVKSHKLYREGLIFSLNAGEPFDVPNEA